MERKRDGFVPLGDVVAGVELPDGRALTPSAPQARHHFTRLDQLVEASEADAELGFMARLLALCSLPRTNPGDRLQFKRANGPYKLIMTATGDAKLQCRSSCLPLWSGTPGCKFGPDSRR